MTWEDARTMSLQKWSEMLEKVRARKPVAELLEEATEACGFCLKALELQQQAGDKKPVQCPFCHLYVEYGGCQSPIDDFQALLVNERWEKAEEWIQKILEDIRRVPLPAE